VFLFWWAVSEKVYSIGRELRSRRKWVAGIKFRVRCNSFFGLTLSTALVQQRTLPATRPSKQTESANGPKRVIQVDFIHVAAPIEEQ